MESTAATALQRALGSDYQVRRLLGRGGFAEVYAAWDVRLKREVAVKVLRPDLGLSIVSLERFRREAEAAATLRHPNVIPVFAVGEREGLAYIIMPLIQGETLRTWLDRQGRFPVSESRRILVELAAALGAAHEIGLVHRDIKPENIMLEGKERRPLLMDFGIVKPATGGTEALTETGLVVGTPYYMSPEQAAADRQVDHRADQYSLAAVGYEMLAGRRVFDGDSVRRVLHQHLSARPERLDTLTNVPAEFAEIIERALAKDPVDRFPTIGEMGTALAELELKPDAEAPVRLAVLPSFPAWGAAGLAAAGVALCLVLYPANHPESGTFTGVRRAVAESIATALFARHGAVGSFDRAASIGLTETDSLLGIVVDARTAVMRALGPTAAVAWARAESPFWRFRIRWSDPVRGERWEGGVVTNYRVVEFTSKVPVQPASESISVDSAETVAHAFLGALGWDRARLSLVDRRDSDRGAAHQFVWEDRIGGIPAPDSGRPGLGTLRAAVTVEGNRVTSFRHYYHATDPAKVTTLLTTRQVIAIAANLLVTVAVIVFLATSLSRRRGSEFRGREMLRLGLLVGLILLVGRLNRWPDLMFDNPRFMLGAVVFTFLAPAVVYLFLILIMGMLGEHLGRETFSSNLEGLVPLLRGKLPRMALSTAGLYGTAVGLAALGLGALAEAASRMWDPEWLPHFQAPIMIYNTISPTLELTQTALVNCLRDGIGLLLVVSLVQLLVRRPPLIIVASAVAMGLLGWTGDHWISATVLGAFWTWIFLRLGLLSCVVAMFVTMVGNLGLEMMTSGAGNSRLLAAAMTAVLLLPIGAALALRRGGHPEVRASAA